MLRVARPENACVDSVVGAQDGTLNIRGNQHAMGESRHSVLQGASIVLLGAFNPKIFHPVWFARNGLIRPTEADDAQVHVVSTEFTFVEFERLRLQSTDRRFSLETVDPRMFGPLRDLAAGTFAVLEHTPIDAFGLNSRTAIELDPESNREAFLERMAPTHHWADLLDGPSLNAMTVEGTRSGCAANRIQISVRPDPMNQRVVAIAVNEHYDVVIEGSAESEPPADFFVNRLHNEWDDFLSYSVEAAEKLCSSSQNGPAECHR